MKDYEEKIVELVMENSVSIQDLLRASNNLNSDYCERILSNKNAIEASRRAKALVSEAIRLLDLAAKIENGEA